MAFEEYPAPKDPNSEIDYGRDWSKFLKEGVQILTSVWEISSTAEEVPTLIMGVNGEGILNSLGATYIWLSGGTKGVKYELKNTITDSEDRTEVMTGIVFVTRK